MHTTPTPTPTPLASLALAAAAVACCLLAACEAPRSAGAANDAGSAGPCGGCAAPRVCRVSNVDVEGTCVAPALEGALCHVDDSGLPPTVTLTHPCDEGLECARVVVDFPTFELVCARAGGDGAACVDYTAVSGDDGCTDPLVCSQAESTCVAIGAVGAPCESDDDCDASVCRAEPASGVLRCVVDECDAGCAEGLVCRELGGCGSTCVEPAAEGALCHTVPYEEPCVFDLPCSAGLDCVVTSDVLEGGTFSHCAVPAALGAPCAGLRTESTSAEDRTTDGCAEGLRCAADSALCVDEDAPRARGDTCESGVPCASGQCDRGRCVEYACDGNDECPPGEGCAISDCARTCVALVADGAVCAVAATAGSCFDGNGDDEYVPCVNGFACAALGDDGAVRCVPESELGGPCDFSTPEDGCRDGLTCSASAEGTACR